jgi:dCMP deaminase
MPHCDHTGELSAQAITLEGIVDFAQEPETGCQVAEHAERNAIAWAARHGLALEGTEVHVTHMPCLSCARTLINAGITKLSFAQPYRLTAGVELLDAAGIEVVRTTLQF